MKSEGLIKHFGYSIKSKSLQKLMVELGIELIDYL